MAPPAVPAPAVTQASWAPDALEELLAPIALYPDQLLGQILAASVNSQEVLDAGNWLLQNESLKGDALDAAAMKAGFGPAMRALVQFPTVVDMMCQQIDWTRQLGSAFTSDQKAVLDAVQRLRVQAADAGNLKSTPQQKVESKAEGDKVIVEVKPADPKVVYVPQYDPQAVYAPAPPAPPPAAAPAQPAAPAASSTTTASGSTVSTGAAVAGGLLAFGVGIVLGKALSDDDDYCYPHWSSGAVFYGPRPFYPPAYVYRPVYGPAFHPAYRYTPPPGYRNSYNNVNVNRNIVVNNNNYFNRFDNNRNLSVNNSGNDWKGQQRYAGATQRDRPGVTPSRAEAARAERVDQGARTDRVDGSARTGRTDAANHVAGARPDAADRAARADRTNAADRAGRADGVDHTARPSPPDRADAATREARADRVDRGYGVDGRTPSETRADAEPRDVATRERVDAQSREARDRPAEQPAVARDNAFAGARDNDAGSFDRAASARGRASSGGRDLRGSHHR